SGTGNNATFLTGNGNLGTVNSQTLTLGGSSTGDIILNGHGGQPNAIIFSGYGAGVLHSDTNGRLTSSLVNLTNATDVSGILPVLNGGSPFEQANGSIFERISTQDLLIGGTSTAAAKFAFTNVGNGTPTASISGTNNNAFSITATGILGTTNAQTLNLGSATTGDINFTINTGNNLLVN